MIQIGSFKAAFQHYQQKKISFCLLQDQAVIVLSLCESIQISIKDALEITQAEIEYLLNQPEANQNYDDLIGGDVYVCEDEYDLLQILGSDFDWADKHNGQWPNVTDVPMCWDACCYLNESHSEPEWAMFLFCWNNAGGPVFYVPKRLWVQARIAEHFQATN